VRHREKYVDVPVSAGRAFVFDADGKAPRRARTLRQFVAEVERTSLPLLEGYMTRGDFSRWIADVFGDAALAAGLAVIEGGRQMRPREAASEIAAAIRARYDVIEKDEAAPARLESTLMPHA
jgi:hypothetical protein